MRAKTIFLFALTALLLWSVTALADDEAKNRWRQSDPRTNVNGPRPEAVGEAQGGTGERVETQLEPGLAAIEEDYRGRMAVLKAQMATAATSEAGDVLQAQAKALKEEWQLAMANRQLELARQAGDAALEAEILGAIDHMANPPQRQAQPVQRDPQTGDAVKGGTR